MTNCPRSRETGSEVPETSRAAHRLDRTSNHVFGDKSGNYPSAFMFAGRPHAELDHHRFEQGRDLVEPQAPEIGRPPSEFKNNLAFRAACNKRTREQDGLFRAEVANHRRGAESLQLALLLSVERKSHGRILPDPVHAERQLWAGESSVLRWDACRWVRLPETWVDDAVTQNMGATARIRVQLANRGAGVAEHQDLDVLGDWAKPTPCLDRADDFLLPRHLALVDLSHFERPNGRIEQQGRPSAASCPISRPTKTASAAANRSTSLVVRTHEHACAGVASTATLTIGTTIVTSRQATKRFMVHLTLDPTLGFPASPVSLCHWVSRLRSAPAQIAQ